MRLRLFLTPAVAIVATAFLSAAPTRTAPARVCESLANVRLPNTTITSTQPIVGGSFTPPGSTNAITNLPPFCRVAGVIAPTKDSHILFEVWLPLEKWNGKFAGVGNGGWAGTISFGALAGQVRRGYATASTNTGHTAMPGEDMARFAFEHPEQLIDFAYRSHHETTTTAKALARAFYARPPEHAYWVGCSSGGYEGLMEAQRFPADYDGIVAGAPANNWTRLMAGDLDAVLAVVKDSASNLPPSALELLNRAVITACDGIDDVVDGVLDDPRRCTFDPSALKCAADQETGACLTPAQVEAARRVYRGLEDPITGAQLYPGLAAGSEPFWPNRNPANPFPIPIAHYKWLVFADPNWDWKTFEFTDRADHQAFLKGESRFARILNATDPNLREFRRRGGKLLQYHGWSDQLIAPQNSIDYYESVVSFFGGRQRDRNEALRDVQTFYRLYLAPDMAHCGSGPGPNSFDLQTALEQWVEHGIAPEAVVATPRTSRVRSEDEGWLIEARMTGSSAHTTWCSRRGLLPEPFAHDQVIVRREIHVTSDQRLVSEHFPRSSQYHPEWVLASASGGANALWVTEWLTTALDLRPGMRVLDLGCGRASSSIFLQREFGVQVWATDLWFSAAENIQRIRDAGVEDSVFPLHADARSLPFAPDFFDAIVSVDSFPYYGTDDLYLNYLAHFVKPGGLVGIAGAGLVREVDGPVPDHLRECWTQDFWALHSAGWWRQHWERTAIMDVEVADTMPDGWQFWLDWQRAVAPDNVTEITAVEADGGRYLGYVRLVGRRRGEAKLEDYCWPDTMRSLPPQYTRKPLLRSQET